MENYQIEERLERIEKLLLGNKKVLTFAETCNYTGLSDSWLYKLTHQKKIPFSKPHGKLNFFELEKINEWLLQNPQKTIDELNQEANHIASFKRK
jgi:excisionase family DNA binding protein